MGVFPLFLITSPPVIDNVAFQYRFFIKLRHVAFNNDGHFEYRKSDAFSYHKEDDFLLEGGMINLIIGRYVQIERLVDGFVVELTLERIVFVVAESVPGQG